MLSAKAVECGVRLALALILGLAVVGSLPIPVQAQAPVDLELGAEGAISWTISNIKPGDTGSMTVELHNAGSRNGFVTIWITDIEEVDYGGDGALLDDCLLFNLSCDRLRSNIALPATIHELPQNTPDANYIRINPLYAEETVTLVWEWEFPETGEPQNDAQGDSLLFSINYLLEELLYAGEELPYAGEELPYAGDGDGGRKPSYQQLEIDILGAVIVADFSSSGKLLDSCIATDPDNKHKLEFSQGTKVTCINGEVPTTIQMRVCEKSLPVPQGVELIGPAYELVSYTSDSAPCAVVFDKPVELTLSYDLSWLPTNTSSINIASYDVKEGWRDLEPPPGSVTDFGKVIVLISHTSTFAILAKLAPSVQVGPLPPTPAEFKLSKLAINPAQVSIGERVVISVVVQNTGELEGSYTLNLRINGMMEQSKETTLAGGESANASFAVIKDKPGTYVVAVDSLAGEFIVLAPPASTSWISIYWWVTLLAVLMVGLLIYFSAIRLRRHA